MATAITERFPTAEIEAQARQIRFSHVLLVLFLGFFWGIGWVTGKLFLGAVMCAISVRRGWRDGYGYEVPQQVAGPQSR